MGYAVSLLVRYGNWGTAFYSVSAIKKIEGKKPSKKNKNKCRLSIKSITH